jgi:hypothetical protein
MRAAGKKTSDKLQKWLSIPAGAALVLMTLIAHAPAINGGFVWEDDAYVTMNPLLTAPDGLKRIWFSLDQPPQYFPLVYTTFRIEHALWGFDPYGSEPGS